MYDYLIVGAGLYGAVFAREATEAGKKVLVVDKRPNIAGNVYTEDVEGIKVHVYGAHIFHTNNREVWDYVNCFAAFNRFTNSPVANYKGELYSLPFNMYTFNKMWGVVTPEEAEAKIAEQRKEITGEPKNLEEQAISLVGRDIFEKLVKGYTEKQWGRDCKDLPAFIIRRLPVRLTLTELKCGWAVIIWRIGKPWIVRQDGWSTPVPLMPSSASAWEHWSTEACGLRRNCWISRTSRGMQR